MKEKAKRRAREIKQEKEDKARRQREQDAAKMDWHKSGKEKNKEVQLLAYTERTGKVSDTKSNLTVVLIDIWPAGEKVCGWDLDEFTDVIDEMECGGIGFETMCSMSRAVEKKKDDETKAWKVAQIYIKKVKRQLNKQIDTI